MKKWICMLLSAVTLLSLSACGRKKETPTVPTPTPAAASSPIFEAKLTPDNWYYYFEYKEYRSEVREDDGRISSVQIAYGLALRDNYTAAIGDEYKNTAKLTFSATGVVRTGDYNVDFATLQYNGYDSDVQTERITETLEFWPKGDRTYTWTYGNFSKSNIMYLEGFQVVDAEGSVFLKEINRA